MNLPPDVLDFFREVFRSCNQRVTEKLSNLPNVQEESLDLTFVEHLSRYSAPITLPSSWIVRIEVHYLGGMRHFYRWEIADIGFLLFVRRQGEIRKSKAALLQSKRLYPTKGTVLEEGLSDYEIGFARLADPEDLARSMTTSTEFRFTDSCRYGALIAGSQQVEAIQQYEHSQGTKVYYQLYNPWRLPFTQRIPLVGYPDIPKDIEAGVRVVPASAIHTALASHQDGYRPRVRDLPRVEGQTAAGWPLEDFVVDEFMACREGTLFESVNDYPIRNMFYRRSGAIAAAVAITIEEPETS